jgi:protein-arginine kinase activator protein McsA
MNFECTNCKTTQGLIETHITNEGWVYLCDDCAAEDQRMEVLAEQLAASPSCEARQRLMDTAETTGDLVNRLRAHDQTACNMCSFLKEAGITAGQAQAFYRWVPKVEPQQGRLFPRQEVA